MKWESEEFEVPARKAIKKILHSAWIARYLLSPARVVVARVAGEVDMKDIRLDELYLARFPGLQGGSSGADELLALGIPRPAMLSVATFDSNCEESQESTPLCLSGVATKEIQAI